MTQNQKEITQYATAITSLFSGVVMCFISFFCNSYSIEGSVLAYLGQMLIFTAGVFGVSIYVKGEMLEAKNNIEKELRSQIKEEVTRELKLEEETENIEEETENIEEE